MGAFLGNPFGAGGSFPGLPGLDSISSGGGGVSGLPGLGSIGSGTGGLNLSNIFGGGGAGGGGGSQQPKIQQGREGTQIAGQPPVTTMGGQNQYMNYPSMTGGSSPFGGGGNYSAAPAMGYSSPIYALPGMAQAQAMGGGMSSPGGMSSGGGSYGPGIVPPSSYGFQPGQNPTMNPQFNPNNIYGAGIGGKLPGNYQQSRTIDPAMTQAMNQYLMNMMGQGASPFNLSALMPSTGQATTPGSLTAPMTPTMQNLQDFLMGKSAGVSGVPGTSGPLSYVSPMWQSEISAMNQPIQQQLANIKEQFGAQGALGSSEMANALQNYGSQTALGEQALLGQLTMQALPTEMQAAGGFQQMDQQAIQNMYNEFIRTRPEYSPLLQEQYGMATTFPPIYQKGGGSGSALMGALPGLGMNAAGSIMEGLSGGGGLTDVISSLAGMLLAA
jgi:hypothetical protein